MADVVFPEAVICSSVAEKQEKIAIAGAGICGLVTALAVADRGYEITIFERDIPPPDGDADEAFFQWQRKGAAQFRHPHAFLGLMCNLLQENYPKLLDEFYEAGARRIDFVDMLGPHLRASYKPEPADEKLWLLSCRRATIETVLRRYVEKLPNVKILSRCTITGLLADEVDELIYVRGVRCRYKGSEAESDFEFESDLVIDASGRTSRFPYWLGQYGADIREEKYDAEIVYYTRHFALNAGQQEPPRDEKRGAGDLGYLKYGVFPGDNGHFAIIICLPLGEKQLRVAVRDGESFLKICEQIPGLERWIDPKRSHPTTQPFGIGDIQSQWRYFVNEGRPVACNFFAVGDVAVRTNPLYGRGCSTGILHAHILADVLAETSDPVTRALWFEQRTEEQLRPIFKTSLREDRSGIKRAAAVMEGRVLDQADSLKNWIRLAFRDAISAAAREDIRVIRGAMKTFNLLETPGEFLKDWNIRMIILRYLLKGRKKNAARRLVSGPGRIELHQALGLAADVSSR
ncbi:MAG: FAD-dependent oxidoreductase [Proteobacteria bacterium]|nr:FAD-dependent oxidoreductase [Pseudomonadota bacterium]